MRQRKLTPDAIQAIRTHCRAYGRGAYDAMSKKFGVTKQMIGRIVIGQNYKDVPEDDLSLNAKWYREIIEALDEYEEHLFYRMTQNR